MLVYSSGQIKRTISETVTLLVDINEAQVNLIDISLTNFGVSSAMREEGSFFTGRTWVPLVLK